jgi:acetyl-CoA carboxylase carboxyltransferase component
VSASPANWRRHALPVKAGSWGRRTVEKQIRVLEQADRDLLPVVFLVDSAGGRLTDALGFHPGPRGAARIFHLQVRLSGRVPQVCCLFGPSVAGGAYMPAFCDWVGMVEPNASMFLASPRIAAKATGEIVTLEEMGGARMHCTVSGCGDELFADDAAAIAGARAFLGYLPQNFDERPRRGAPEQPESSDWDGCCPRATDRPTTSTRSYVVSSIGAACWRSKHCGRRRCSSASPGSTAVRSDWSPTSPRCAAARSMSTSADKAARFISLCDAFNLPLIFLADLPGFMIGSRVERAGIIRHGAKMIAAMSSAEVPRFCVVLRKAYPAGYYAMSSPGFAPRATIALAGAQIGAMAAEAAVNAVWSNKIEELEDEREREAFISERRTKIDEELDAIRVASELMIEAVVDPADLRAELCARLAAADGWRRVPPHRHHGAFPV